MVLLGLSVLVAALLSNCGGGGGSSAPLTSSPSGSSPLGSPVITTPAAFADGLSGTQAIAVNAPGAASVQLQLDGVALGTATTAPFQLSFDADQLVDGQHVLRARALDAAGGASAWSTTTIRTASGRDVNAGFTKTENWVTGLASATAIGQLPDGRLLVAEQGGALRVVKAGVLLPAPAVRLTVDFQAERGLLGIAVHPAFASNGWVYLYYTVPGVVSHNRISRFVMRGDTTDGTETVIADLPALGTTAHNGGGMQFGPDGTLFVGVGDNEVSANAQNLSVPFGKMLRFNDDGSIPADNPFCNTTGQLACAVWALGLRNPFNFAIQAGTGLMLIDDVGESTWEEIDVGRSGANYGWPMSEGVDGLGPGIDAPLFVYGHQPANPPGSGPGGFFTGVASLGVAIIGATFYPSGTSFPVNYDGNFFFADYGAGWVARLDLANENDAYAFAQASGPLVGLLAGSDGALYVLSRSSISRITSP